MRTEGDGTVPASRRERSQDRSAFSELMEKPLDPTDVAIVHRLRTNGRLPFKAIADELGLSEAAVRKRVNRMVEGRLIQIVAVPAPRAYDRALMGTALLSVRGDPGPAAEAISAWSEVTWLSLIAGRGSILLEFVAADRDELMSLTDRLHRVAGVSDIEVLVYLRTVKQTFLGPLRHRSPAPERSPG